MSEILVKEKEIAVPGELLAKGMDVLPGAGAYRKDDEIYANKVGLVSLSGRSIKLIPVSGAYVPKRDDVIIGKIIDITMNGWRIDVNSAFSAMMNVRDASNTFIQKGANLSRIFDIGDYVVAKITQVTSQMLIDVTMRGNGLRPLQGGQIIKYSANKFPRIIGKQGSMVSQIKNVTGCQITVGQNGLIWISGEPEKEVIAVKAIRFIEKYAHTQGLTQKVNKFLEEECGGKK